MHNHGQEIYYDAYFLSCTCIFIELGKRFSVIFLYDVPEIPIQHRNEVRYLLTPVVMHPCLLVLFRYVISPTLVNLFRILLTAYCGRYDA